MSGDARESFTALPRTGDVTADTRVESRLREYFDRRQDDLVALIERLAKHESPTDVPHSQRAVQDVLREELAKAEYEVRYIPGTKTGGHLYARPARRPEGPVQLMVGHTDTVWPIGTLKKMPVIVEEGRLKGPGVFDMKGGVAFIVFAIQGIHDLGLQPPMTPVAFFNSDEEIGSPESKSWIRRLAKASERAFILEPPVGPTGIVKTARKGVGRFQIIIRGKAAHAGLDPDAGASSILEMSHVIQTLHAMNDRERGTSVNVGVVAGGQRPNVIPAECRAFVDIRVANMVEGEALEAAVRSLEPTTPGTSLTVQGGIKAPPLERTPRNRILWETATGVGHRLGLELEEAMVGGGSDGNTTSQHTATLDGLGAVGDGAHARHEFVYLDRLPERAALLAGLLMAP